MMYSAYQAQADLIWPLRAWAKAVTPILNDPWTGLSRLPAARKLAAALETFSLVELTHRRPSFRIDEVMVDGKPEPIVEEPVLRLPFGTLLRFAKPAYKAAGGPPQPRVLIAAPMSGHFATLLRDTVRTMLQDHEVYVTDWHNARDVSLADGRFGLDEYTEYLMTFLREMGPGSHLLAVCQPCVASLAATALMNEDGDEAAPASLTLMAGPIDCRISPTTVNDLANGKSIEWFENNLISRVPWRFAGAMRRVYPGFIQLTAFMSMNKERHVGAFKDYYRNLLLPDLEKATFTKTFYDEYLAVADLPAEFYLETVRKVFQEYLLPQGKLTWRDRNVDTSAIRRTALLTIEGERDDICAVGQTMAAQDLCPKLRPYMRTHYVQAGVGHYGVFSGKRWQQQIYPIVRSTIAVSQ